MSAISRLQIRRQRRVNRVRNKIRSSNVGKLRLSVFRSNRHISAQVIDDSVGSTIVSASSEEPTVRNQLSNGGNALAASLVGRLIGERCAAKGLCGVVFDRGMYKYHGRLAALANAAREAGLSF